jgi:hypothetical protein
MISMPPFGTSSALVLLDETGLELPWCGSCLVLLNESTKSLKRWAVAFAFAALWRDIAWCYLR